MYNIDKKDIYQGNWTSDTGISLMTNPEIYNEDAINQSIEMILATPIGSRLFNINFGSNFSLLIFDNFSEEHVKSVIDNTIDAIDKWEPRITILRDNIEVVFDTGLHLIDLTIPYIINHVRVRGEFHKVIRE